MSERNIVDVIIYPETPKVTPNEVFYVYVPKASSDTPGIAAFNLSHFTVQDGVVSLLQTDNQIAPPYYEIENSVFLATPTYDML